MSYRLPAFSVETLYDVPIHLHLESERSDVYRGYAPLLIPGGDCWEASEDDPLYITHKEELTFPICIGGPCTYIRALYVTRAQGESGVLHYAKLDTRIPVVRDIRPQFGEGQLVLPAAVLTARNY